MPNGIEAMPSATAAIGSRLLGGRPGGQLGRSPLSSTGSTASTESLASTESTASTESLTSTDFSDADGSAGVDAGRRRGVDLETGRRGGGFPSAGVLIDDRLLLVVDALRQLFLAGRMADLVLAVVVDPVGQDQQHHGQHDSDRAEDQPGQREPAPVGDALLDLT